MNDRAGCKSLGSLLMFIAKRLITDSRAEACATIAPSLLGDTRMRTGRLLAVVAVVVAPIVGLTNGCAPYVNVPAQQGDVAANDPNTKPVPEVAQVALEAVVTDSNVNVPFYVVLPDNTSQSVYTEILPKVSAHARRSPRAVLLPVKGKAADTQPAPAPEPAAAPDGPEFDVKQVRVRGWRAEVDIVRPAEVSAPAGRLQLVTVDLQYDPVAGWNTRQIRVWRTSVEKALRLSPYRSADENIR